MPRRDFTEALKDYDRLVRDLPTDAGAQRVLSRLAARLEPSTAKATAAGRGRRLGVWVGAAAACGAVALAVVTVMGLRARAPAQVGGFAVADAAEARARVERDGVVVIDSGSARLSAAGVTLEVTSGTRLRRESRGVRLLSGRVQVSVRPRRPGEAPARVLVSRGAIEVMGTRFSVIERGDSGEVTLEEGKIHFVVSGGRTVVLAPGESHRWPEPDASDQPAPGSPALPLQVAPPEAPLPPASASERRAAVSPRSSSARRDIEPFLERILELRHRGHYAEAVGALEAELRQPLPLPTRERLSYEMGAILSGPLVERDRACRHWEKHAHLFRQGRYEREVAELQQKLDCLPAPR